MVMYEILPYTPDLADRFDRFINEESINGTFLQTRRFLDYHPAGRFKDASFIVHISGTIVAVVPGAEITSDHFEKPAFVSHPGTTFGGPILSEPAYHESHLSEILKTIDAYFSERYSSVRLKLTPNIFSRISPDLMEYLLEHMGYTRKTELSAICHLSKTEDPLDRCDRKCRRVFRDTQGHDIEYRELRSDEEFETFYKYLEISKEKFGVKPVHTLEELYDLKDNRIPENIRFRGIWDNGIFVGALMTFFFNKTNTRHGQYIAVNPDFKEFQPATALYVYSMREAASEGVSHFSWGISTENHGDYLNENLFRFKQSFGALGAVNPSYEKTFV